MRIGQALKAVKLEQGSPPGFYTRLSEKTGIPVDIMRKISADLRAANAQEIAAIRGSLGLPDTWPPSTDSVRETTSNYSSTRSNQISWIIDLLADPELLAKHRAEAAERLREELGIKKQT